MDQQSRFGQLAGVLLSMTLRLPGGVGALRRLFKRSDYALLREAVAEEGDVALRAVVDELPEVHHRVMSADDFALFRRMARESNGAALRAILQADDYSALREFLAANGHGALKAVVLDGDGLFFECIVRSREGRPLAEALFADRAKLLRDVCRLRGDDALAPVLEADGGRIARGLPPAVRDDFTERLLRAGAAPAAEAYSGNLAALEGVLATPRAGAILALQRKWNALAGVIPVDDPGITARYREGMRTIQSAEHVRGRVLDAVTEGDVVRLAGGSLEFACRHSLWTLMHEILLNEDYYFECDSDAPVIIDGGAHMGMAVYYFKSLYPNAHITAFEPEPALRAMLERNVALNSYRDVTVLPYALAKERATAAFHVSKDWSMAGSLSDYRSALGEASETVPVECVPLSEYLDGPVDFLKLDIEGVEDDVLAEAAPKLANVRYVFCEFHQGPGLAPGRLARILGVLDAAGFDVQVGKSHNYQETSRSRPFTHFGGGASQIIWGKQR